MLIEVVVFFDVAEYNAVVAWAPEVQKSELVPQRPHEEHC